MSFQPFNPFSQPQKQKPQGPVAGTKVGGTKEEARAKRNKVLRFMFNPELGQGFDSMRETHLVFLGLVANIFLQTGLIDATYPGLRDPKQLKLATLIRTAHEGLQYTRDGMPRVMLFYSFVGSMVAVVLSILVFIITIMSAHPHAPQAAPAQQPPAVEQPQR